MQSLIFKQQPMSEVRIERVEGDDQFRLLAELRRQIYQQAGKIAGQQAYHSTLDGCGEAYLVFQNKDLVGTFSICRLGHLPQARATVGQQWGVREAELQSALYVYFLGIKKEARQANLIKFVFAEIFKILVKSDLQDIYVLADARLTSRYRWIGLKPTSKKVKSAFPKSGWLQLLHTRQKRFGIYGLHADPIRWNWYLKTPTQQLITEGYLPNSRLMILIFGLYSLFAPIAKAAEQIAVILLRSQTSGAIKNSR